jgi:galactokinase
MRTVQAFAPGRVNLIGEHTDYNAGLALPFALAEGVTVRASALDESRVHAIALDLGESDVFSLDAIEPASGWRAFVRGTVAELSRRAPGLGGARLEITGSVPRGGGLGSSGALGVALGLALGALAGSVHSDGVELAKACARVENVWVGARSGLLDQLAALFSEREHALAIDFRSLAIRPVTLQLEGYRLVLLDSGERHANAALGYNQRRAECDQACAVLGIASLRDARVGDLERLPARLADRARHVLEENARVEQAIEALERRDPVALGQLLVASHESSRDLYELSTPAVEAAVERLRQAGAVGARLVGGGFGGHILGLMPPGTELPPDAFEVRASGGARVVVAE